jgi:cytochrome c-type biogenesis protein CcmH
MISFIAIFMIFSVYTAGESLFIFNSYGDEARYYEIINEIRCPKCTSGSLSSSNAPISEDLKRKIYELIQEGRSDKEIKDYVVQRYGKDSLYEPDFSENLFLWLSPAVFLIIIAVSVLLIRRR